MPRLDDQPGSKTLPRGTFAFRRTAERTAGAALRRINVRFEINDRREGLADIQLAGAFLSKGGPTLVSWEGESNRNTLGFGHGSPAEAGSR